MMAKYPIFLELSERRVVLIGGGGVALRKAQALIGAGARLVVVSKQFDDVLIGLCQGKAELVKSAYSKEHLAGAVLAIAATNKHELNKQIYKDCQELQILCNVVDVPELCDFYVPAVVKRGDLQITIGTDGNCPAYAGHLRKKLQEQFTDQHGQFVAELEKIRKKVIEDIADPAGRKALLGQLVDDESFDYFVQNGTDGWVSRAEKIISEFTA